MIVTVQLFARAREVVGCDKVSMDVPDDGVVADVRRELARRYPALGGLVERSAIAVNDEYAGDACRLSPGAELALLPPVSGG